MATKIAGLFFCFTLLLIGTIVLLKEMSLEYNSVIQACKYALSGAVLAGFLGFLIGKVFDKGRKVSMEKLHQRHIKTKHNASSAHSESNEQPLANNTDEQTGQEN